MNTNTLNSILTTHFSTSFWWHKEFLNSYPEFSSELKFIHDILLETKYTYGMVDKVSFGEHYSKNRIPPIKDPSIANSIKIQVKDYVLTNAAKLVKTKTQLQYIDHNGFFQLDELSTSSNFLDLASLINELGVFDKITILSLLYIVGFQTKTNSKTIFTGNSLQPSDLTKEQESLYFARKLNNYSSQSWVGSNLVDMGSEEKSRISDLILSKIPFLSNVEITHLSKRMCVCMVDGIVDSGGANNQGTPKALNCLLGEEAQKLILDTDCNPKFVSLDSQSQTYTFSKPVVYVGEAYFVKFTTDGKDPFKDNLAVVVTPDMFEKWMNLARPKLMEQHYKGPWDDLMYISNIRWCERDLSQDYGEEMGHSCPLEKRMSFTDWVLTNLAQKAAANSTPIISMVSGANLANERATKLNRLINRLSVKETTNA